MNKVVGLKVEVIWGEGGKWRIQSKIWRPGNALKDSERGKYEISGI